MQNNNLPLQLTYEKFQALCFENIRKQVKYMYTSEIYNIYRHSNIHMVTMHGACSFKFRIHVLESGVI